MFFNENFSNERMNRSLSFLKKMSEELKKYNRKSNCSTSLLDKENSLFVNWNAKALCKVGEKVNDNLKIFDDKAAAKSFNDFFKEKLHNKATFSFLGTKNLILFKKASLDL